MIIVSNLILFPLATFVLGYYIVETVMKREEPIHSIKASWIRWAILTIIVVTFIPVLTHTFYIVNDFNAPFWSTYQTVLLSYRVGNVWLAVIALGALLIIASIRKVHPGFSLALMVVLFFVIGLTSHSAALSPVAGYMANMLHLLAIAFWIGTLFVTVFATKHFPWSWFISWFSPLAIISVAVLVGSGLFMMRTVTPEYVNSWVLPYGQLLLLKHLVFIPLLMFGVVHGFFLKKRVEQGKSPKRSFAIESGIALVILFITSIMIEQVPPHVVEHTIESNDPSSLFLLIKGVVSLPLTLAFQPIGLLFGSLAVTTLAYLFVVIRLQKGYWLSVFLTLCFVLFGYIALMGSVN
ncbi:copper resistance D family protein [Bacillus alkalicellulosilyticus]|uniref:copper resistance D family protein n=1 Tax=Alkalihalobacterium alkalicellulosilyticum TaxID=1912214 RepID=UPI0009976DFC|nr:CopD family protein [Bacillus alkalicellulosilyticus]